MKNNILKAINQFDLLGDCNKVTVALSGGADSMALLYALNSLKNELSITLKAAHLNHMIRGEEALRDEIFVKEQCNKLGIDLVCERIDVPKVAKESSKSLELAAREVRYDFLKRVSENGLVATAHTASDNLETLIFNFTRGTSIDGLCGIPPKRDIFIRPLIFCTRSDVEKYCEDNKISYITDSTNLCDDYTRNKIRHNVIPILKEINGNVEKTASNMALNLTDDAKALESMAKCELSNRLTDDGGVNLEGFSSLTRAVATRLIKYYIESKITDVSLQNVHITSCFNDTAVRGVRTSLPGDFSAVNKHGVLYVLSNGEPEIADFKVSLSDCDSKNLITDKKINNLLLKSAIDCDKIVGKLEIRTRKAGDSISVAGRGCTKTLNKIFNEMGIDVALRDRLPVISDDLGVVWVYNIGVSKRCAVSNSTKNIKIIKVQGE